MRMLHGLDGRVASAWGAMMPCDGHHTYLATAKMDEEAIALEGLEAVLARHPVFRRASVFLLLISVSRASRLAPNLECYCGSMTSPIFFSARISPANSVPLPLILP